MTVAAIVMCAASSSTIAPDLTVRDAERPQQAQLAPALHDPDRQQVDEPDAGDHRRDGDEAHHDRRERVEDGAELATAARRRPPPSSPTFVDSIATANIVTSVTPITTPIAMRLERSGIAQRVLGRQARGRRATEQPADEPQHGRHHERRAEREARERQDAADERDDDARAG